MLLFLAPWIVLWSAPAIHPVIGGAAAVAVAALVPLLWLRFRPVVFEQFSIPLVTGISLAVLLGAPVRILVPASHFLFGLMWVASAFAAIPLTARYSAKNHGGESAFANPLFLRTNRILTVAWGVLNLATPCWTYAIMGTGLSRFVGLINQGGAILLGIFTLWFIQWYPARWARG